MSLRGKRWVRIGWQALLIGYVGLASGSLISIALFGGWAAKGVAFRTAPGLVLLAAAALLVPLATRRNIYCHHVCPHGAAQLWLGAVFRRKRALPFHPRLAKIDFRLLLLAFAIVALLSGWRVDLSQIEPFDAWVWRTATAITLAIMLAGFTASLFIPQAYCRFACPTGALLNLVRSGGAADHWRRRDSAAGVLLLLSFLAFVITRAGAEHPVETRQFHGRTMGTTWSVKLRDAGSEAKALESVIQAEYDRIEQLTSHWRSNTPLAQFNHSKSTNAMTVPTELETLLRWSVEISEASGGAFDVTVAPLVRLWGFGPAPQRDTAPTPKEVSAAQSVVGWTNLILHAGALRKLNMETELDLSSIVPGWANDRVAALLKERGFTNFLVESGGELRASGDWQIGIEHPARSCRLRDESIGTSGTYRQNWKAATSTFSHLIDPRTGRPVSHSTVSVSVRLPDCARADAWAAALNVLGLEAGMPIAESMLIPAQFVSETNGNLAVHQSSHWH